MTIQTLGETVTVSGLLELNAINAVAFREEMITASRESPTIMEIDLTHTRFVDSAGLGALFGIYKAVAQSGTTTLRLLNPRPDVRQLLELTQMEKFFQIVQR